MGALFKLTVFFMDWVARSRCARGHHVWERHDTVNDDGQITGSYKVCVHCMKTHYVIDVPAGHPDATPIDMTPAQINVLAELDQSL